MNAGSLFADTRKAWLPPPDIKTSQWADQYRMVSRASPMPGKWRNSTTPYLTGIMDAHDDPDVFEIDFVKASRLGATEGILNIMFKHIHLDPLDMIYAQTSDGEANKFVKKILQPAIDSNALIKDIVADTQSRGEDASTAMLRMFPGGTLNLVGGSSAKPFRMVAVPVVFGDDIDGMPEDVDGEGDPIDLLISRTKNFWYRKIFLASTTTVKATSRIWARWLASDMRYYFVQCQNPSCGEYQRLEFGSKVSYGLQWEGRDPSTARYICKHCGFPHIDGKHKKKMLLSGVWKATAEFHGKAGFHLSRLYSPFVPWSEMVGDWLDAQGQPKRLKVFINHALAEPVVEENVIELDGERLFNNRREHYPEDDAGRQLLPSGVCFLTAGVDVQHDRFELEILGHGLKDETWSIDYRVIYCDTSIQENYSLLQPVWDQKFPHAKNENLKLRISAAAIDSGDGSRTKQVYDYVAKMDGKHNIYAIKGVPGAGKPVASVGKKQGKGESEDNVIFFNLGVDSIKSTVFAHLKISHHGPGFCHFPRHYERNYFDMLTAERAVLKKVGRRLVRVFEKVRDRNESLDCRVYALGALEISGANIDHYEQVVSDAAANMRNVSQRTKENEKPLFTISEVSE